MGASLGFRDYINGFWEWIRNFGLDLTGNFDIEEADLPTGTTNEELDDVVNAMIDTGESGTEFLFSAHHLGEAIVNFFSPYNLSIVIVAIISAIFGILLFHKVFKASLHHIFLFIIALTILTVVVLVIGPVEFPDN